MCSHPCLRGVVLLAGAFALTASPAQADVIPSGYKGVKLSIEVVAEVPEGHTLLLLNTFKGATKLEPGKAVDVQWHPLHGKMQMVSATAAQVVAIESIADEHLGDERMPKMQAQSTPCAEPFDGVRTVKDTEGYDEIRWHYTVSVDAKACKGTLARTSYLSDGAELKAVPSAKPSADAAAKDEPSAPATEPPKNAPPTPASTCAMRELASEPPGGTAAMLLLAALALLARDRRRRPCIA